MRSFYTDRSRVIGFQDCGRKRFLAYHESGLGLSPIKKPLPLAVGGAVHAGIEVLLRGGQDFIWGACGRADDNTTTEDALALLFEFIPLGGSVPVVRELEEEAVRAALLEFAKFSKHGLELDALELEGLKQGVGQNLGAELAKSLGLPEDHPDVLALLKHAGDSQEKFDLYLVEEQGALVEAMVRAYTRRRLRPLLTQFEVLEVEREGTWSLSSWKPGWPLAPIGEHNHEIVFMSRPDALLRDRESNQLLLLSLKTTAGWDVRKARDAEHDMQGLSEGVEVEGRLGKWWQWSIGVGGGDQDVWDAGCNQATMDFLRSLSSAPRIYAIRYEYLLKGDRRINETLGQELGVQARVQNSHLIRPYCNPGMASGDAQWCWSYRFKKDDGGGSNLYYKNWKTAPVWKAMSIKTWIDLLDAAVETYSAHDPTMGLEPRLLGFSCAGQATGYTEKHPLDDVFLEPITVFRHDDDLRDWIDQTEAQEVRVVEGLVQIEQASLSEKRHLLNVYFPMVRTSCEFPSTCAFVRVCYANNEDTKMNPLGSGLFSARVPNHLLERNADRPH